MLNLQSPQWKLEWAKLWYHWIFGYSILGQIQRSGPKTLMNFHDSPIEFEDFPGVWHRALGAKLRSFLCWCHFPPSRREVGNESSLQCLIDLNWRELILIDLNWSHRLSHILGLNWCEKAIVWLIDPSVDAAPQLEVGRPYCSHHDVWWDPGIFEDHEGPGFVDAFLCFLAPSWIEFKRFCINVHQAIFSAPAEVLP